MLRRVALCLGFVASVTAPQSASAALVTLTFSGRVSFIQPHPDIPDTQPLVDSLGSAGTPGSPFSGSLTFDDSSPPSSESSLGNTYPLAIPPGSFSARLGTTFLSGAMTWTAPSFEIDTYLTPGDEPPNVDIRSTLASSRFGYSASFEIYLKDAGHPLSSPALDRIPWDISLYPDHEIAWTIQSVDFPGESVVVFANGSDFTFSATVPEPNGAALWLLGCLPFPLLRLRRRAPRIPG